MVGFSKYSHMRFYLGTFTGKLIVINVCMVCPLMYVADVFVHILTTVIFILSGCVCYCMIITLNLGITISYYIAY